MLSDCEKCENKGSEQCKYCCETSGGKPSMFKQKDEENCIKKQSKFMEGPFCPK